MDSSKETIKLTEEQDYPQTYREFMVMFPDNQSCIDYLVKLRWGDEFICPKCQTPSIPWEQTNNRFTCPSCRHQTTVTAGTIFDKTRTPLIVWFEVAWHITTAKNGMSAQTIEQTLGISYRTAWTMLQRFRIAMVNTHRTKLSGTVEIDETLVGGIGIGGKRGRGSEKSVVVIAIEMHEPKGFGRVRMRLIPDASADSLRAFINDVVQLGSTINTDGWRGYSGLNSLGYKHKVTVLSNSIDQAHITMPGVHRVASLLKRWILGTHQGSFSTDHLQSYLEEYTFRFNRRLSKNRGLIFKSLIKQVVATSPITEKDVTNGYNWENSMRRS